MNLTDHSAIHEMNTSFMPVTETSLDEDQAPTLSIPYVVCEVLVAVTAVVGNALTVMVFVIERRLRRLTNYYIVSLALADLLVGMPGIPFAILTSMGIPSNPWLCSFMLSLLLILCTVSILCLVAVSVDRYWAILYPLRYSRVMTAKIARRIITLCWIAGICIGILPMIGWREEYGGGCIFVEVMDYNYLVFIYFSTIVGPGLLMAVFYTHIYTVVLKQLRQIAAQEPQSEGGSMGHHSTTSSQKQRPYFLLNRSHSRAHVADNWKLDSRRSSTATNIVHQVTHASRREVKAAKSLSIIVLFFMICWFPLYTINCVQAFCDSKQCPVPQPVMFICIILTHVNSAVNPFLYAYHMKDFRFALKSFILHRILRRPAHFDNATAHFSTVYRVAVGGGSPQLPNLHTPHAHNTPITSSSPIASTPGGLKSRSSTLGSYGPWIPSRGVSPTTSYVKTPEGQAEPSHRPRAATINTHTSPASACSPVKEKSKGLKPILSETNICDLVKDPQNVTNDHQASDGAPESIAIDISHIDPPDVNNGIPGDNYQTDIRMELNNENSTRHETFGLEGTKLNTISKPEFPNSVSGGYQDKMGSSPSVNSILDAIENTNANAENYHVKLQIAPRESELTHNADRVGEYPKTETPEVIDSNNHSVISNKCHNDSSICNAKADDSIETGTFNKNHMRPQYLGIQDRFHNDSNEDKFIPEQETLLSQIPNGTDDNKFCSDDNVLTPLNSGDRDTRNEVLDRQIKEATSKQYKIQESTEGYSHSDRELYKYLPKILKRKDESKFKKFKD